MQNRILKTTKAKITKKKIYKSAEQLFKKHGFENVSVDAIVESAGVSKGTFYVHFESKSALITSLISDSVKKVDLDYLSYLKSLPPDTKASEKLLMISGKIADTISLTLGYERMKIIYENLLTKTVDTEAILAYSRELYVILNAIVSLGIQQGEFRADMSADTIVRHLIIGMRGMTYEWCIRYPDFDLKAEVQLHTRLLLGGIKTSR